MVGDDRWNITVIMRDRRGVLYAKSGSWFGGHRSTLRDNLGQWQSFVTNGEPVLHVSGAAGEGEG